MNGLAGVQGFEQRLYIKTTEPIGVGFSEATRASVLTTDEIRIELGYEALAPEQKVVEQKLAAQDFDVEMRLCSHFSQTGYDLDKWEVVGEGREVRFNSQEQLEANESRLKRFGFTSEAFDFAVLEILKKTPTATWESIAAQLETTMEEVVTAVQNLQQANYMTIGTDAIADSTQRSVEITKQGNSALETAEPLEVTFKVAYRYVKSGEAAGVDIIPTTRDFCKRMVNESKSRVWDSAQIQQVGMQEDRNVWLRRGGFWTRKGTNTTTPYCRHVWEQVVIKEK